MNYTVKFINPSDGHMYEISSIPFVACVLNTDLSVICDKKRKHLENINEILYVMPEEDLPDVNEIFYTSIDGSIVNPYSVEALPTITNNEYKDGIGIITCESIIESICGSAFYENSSLTSIIIPDSVTSIGDYAFYGCNNLKSITCNTITPPDISTYSFGSTTSNVSVYVPAGSITEYQSAIGWSRFTNYIELPQN